jgi:hypothetical protein
MDLRLCSVGAAMREERLPTLAVGNLFGESS